MPAHVAARHCRSVFLRQFSNHGFGGDQQTSDGSCVLQSSTDNLGRVDDASFDHVDELFGLSVEAEGRIVVFLDLANNDGAFDTSVFSDLTDRSFQSAQDDLDTSCDVGVVGGQAFDCLLGAQQSGTATRDDAFFNGSAGCVQSVVDAVFFLFHFDFGRTANADNGNAACELCKTLLELLTVVIGSGFFDLSLDLGNAAVDVVLGAQHRQRWWCFPW